MSTGQLLFGGYAGAIVVTDPNSDGYIGASRHTNGEAELQASTMASLWMLQSGLTRFQYCYDATYANSMAEAMATPKTNKKLVGLVAALGEWWKRVLQTFRLITRLHTRNTHGTNLRTQSVR